MQARALVNCVGPTVKANARIYALAFKADFPGDFPLFWDASPGATEYQILRSDYVGYQEVVQKSGVDVRARLVQQAPSLALPTPRQAPPSWTLMPESLEKAN